MICLFQHKKQISALKSKVATLEHDLKKARKTIEQNNTRNNKLLTKIYNICDNTEEEDDYDSGESDDKLEQIRNLIG